jgi:probable H4MPT-linked C1 transfer pathway protein
MNTRPTWLGLDIGGANLKAAIAHPSDPWSPPLAVTSRPFEVWRHPDRLAHELPALVAALPPTHGIAVTMTAESCDCFDSIDDGVQAVLEAVVALGQETRRPVRVFGLDREFYPPDDPYLAHFPRLAAASNWLALALVAARRMAPGRGLLIDVGSTTTDLTPTLSQFVIPPVATDYDRLRSGQLVYAGVRRTPLCALATSLPWKGAQIGLAAELFATTWDVYLVLGRVPEQPDRRDTADGRPATVAHASDRLLRMIGACTHSALASDALDLARAFHKALLTRLVATARQVVHDRSFDNLPTVIAGSGSFLAHDLADALGIPPDRRIDLADPWTRDGSDAACAVAVSILASEAEGTTP